MKSFIPKNTLFSNIKYFLLMSSRNLTIKEQVDMIMSQLHSKQQKRVENVKAEMISGSRTVNNSTPKSTVSSSHITFRYIDPSRHNFENYLPLLFVSQSYIWAGHWLLSWLKEPWETNCGRTKFFQNKCSTIQCIYICNVVVVKIFLF